MLAAINFSFTLIAQEQDYSGGTLAFKVITGEESGLKEIMLDWHDEELRRQGGKFQSHGWWLWGLTALDVDNDGDMDLVPTHHGISGGAILKNQFKETGKLTFVNLSKSLGIEQRTLPQGIGLKTTALDLDGDGWLDLVGIRSAHFRNEGGKTFTAPAKSRFSTLHTQSVEDVNADGFPDIVDGRHIHLSDPEAFSFKTQPRPFASINDRLPEHVIRAALEKEKTSRFWRRRYHTGDDLNGDGIDDVVFSGISGYSKQALAFYLVADRSGQFTDATKVSGLPGDAHPALIADLNSDGHVDVLATDHKTAGGLYLNDGNGRFTLKDGPLTGFVRRVGPYAERAWPVDFDCDRDLDLVVSNPRYSAERVFENAGESNFNLVIQHRGWDSAPIAICDIDGDDRLDVVSGGPKTDITIFLNQSQVGNYCNLYPRMDKPNWTAAGALVEVFKPADLGKPGSRPFLKQKAHADATPIHIGLGTAKTFDLRVSFPGKDKKVIELTNVEAKPRLKITLDGKINDTSVGAYVTDRED